ncbi:RagB/SusD family nutrient uptake outer membrane protein [Cyclobacterium amurskyense]|uniref:Putative nutrient binding outer membrane protein n=1 Tax=Cyclobacterium amurskyense TaxID=320787 RepID=A0A0H4PJV1_9BACT|nr:RagB/SusD family nutrient uptake outer membrane protein [Cyclobacterium amurskyense]AKP53238.1 Putative nutrient binding outer membrane protein [Cyclobacterium amurskyense]
MKKYIYYLFILNIFWITSCNEEFMDRYPQTSIAPEEFFKTEQDLQLYVNGLLSLPGTFEYQSDQSSDNLATTGAVEIKSILTGSPSSQNVIVGWNWGRLRNINYFLENSRKANASLEVIQHYEGIARYYRAIFYSSMVKRYSDVPWYEQLLSPTDEELYKGRDSRETVVDGIMEDLAFANEHVNADVATGTPGNWAVKVFYARFALYEGTFRKYHDELGLQNTADTFLQKASEIAKTIMDSGKFSIYNTGNPDNDYKTLFNSQDLTGNSEVILFNAYDINKDRSSNVNTGVFGTYEQSPARDLVQSYLMADGSKFTDKPDYDKFSYVEEFKDRDPRLYQTLVYPGWVRVPESSPYIPILNRNFSGYYQHKGYSNTTDNIELGSLDFPVYRYAEVLLTYAEAMAELGTLTQADLDASVNLLRNRVGMPALMLNEANTQPDPVMMSKYPKVSGPMAGVLLEIRRERRVEFAVEGYRFDDLMRYGAGKLLENIPEGMYFSGLGKFDLTGDGIPDIFLVDKSTDIPEDKDKEVNELGKLLIYYKTGTIDDNVTVYLENGENGGTMVTEVSPRNFIEPKYYYRPIPVQQVALNPNLEQIFGWE